ncbi:MAG: glycosyltransferase [Oscillatoria sp. PMC 1068.18]|nr:glycosyltransferase [Oscillatoria sp. PMC 1068.18]
MKCNICQSQTYQFSNAKILNKYNIDYFQCSNCGFVQTEEPFWLKEAYSQAIASSDVGLVYRNLNFAKIVSGIIFHNFDHNANFLDYGAGYGLFVRLMRDAGFNFYWEDKFCQNIFAKGFESTKDRKYELVTAFEVFEHFVNPLSEIENILKYSQNILFSTELLPSTNPKPNQWWYYALEEGQHISLYTKKALLIIADRFNFQLYSNDSSLHLLTPKKLSPLLFNYLSTSELTKKESLLHKDYLQLTGKIANSQDEKPNNEDNDAQKIISVSKLIIIIDGVFFQLYKTGIARVWQTLLEEWSKTEFAEYIIILDRGGTAPKIEGIKYILIKPYDYNKINEDRQILQLICDREKAVVFISTYYTTPITTPSVFMGYDMIPEVMKANLQDPMWQAKHQAIKHASAYITISENTAKDLVKYFPEISLDSVTVAHCGVDRKFFPAKLEEINSFKNKYGIGKPYFLVVGAGAGYKNTILFFKSYAELISKSGFEVVCTGRGGILNEEFRAYSSGSIVHTLQLSDEELRTAYSGAVALVYPSKYEGFGMPIIEAMACGCPVITCPNGSIPEVAGEAVIYVNDKDVNGLANALCDVQKPEVRNSLVAAGLKQVKKFSWETMAEKVSVALINATLLPLNLKEINLIIFPDWSQPEEALGYELQQVLKAIATHSDKNQITLLINIEDISEEDAQLLLSAVAMNLLMEEDLDVSEGPEISFLGQLSDIQWESLLPQIQARIILENENKEHLARYLPANFCSYKLDSLQTQIQI